MVVFAVGVALLAVSGSARKAIFHDAVKAGVIGREFFIEIGYGVLLRLIQNVVFALDIAHEEGLSFAFLVVKG
jgi:hypothetical protein